MFAGLSVRCAALATAFGEPDHSVDCIALRETVDAIPTFSTVPLISSPVNYPQAIDLTL
ncbi:hypothetical protein ABMA59_35270 [Mesorhizobium sp. CN2-181]